MTTALISHPACFDHAVPQGHPERPDRLRAVLGALEAEPFALLLRETAPRADRVALARVHPGSFVDSVLGAVPATGLHYLDIETIMSPGSGEAALRAAGAVVRAVDLIAAGTARNVFCAVRPPGHHAEPGTPMGFCLFNSIAVGALHARAAHGARRVAVVDFDVHHGNGTQAVAFSDPDFFYASTHQSPLYPGTGTREERGVAGNILNVPLPPGTAGPRFRKAFETEILPALQDFKPDWVFISAGFDAHGRDPLANLALTAEDFAWATTALCAVASETANGRLVSALEGGYDLDALAMSTAAHVGALMAG